MHTPVMLLSRSEAVWHAMRVCNLLVLPYVEPIAPHAWHAVQTPERCTRTCASHAVHMPEGCTHACAWHVTHIPEGCTYACAWHVMHIPEGCARRRGPRRQSHNASYRATSGGGVSVDRACYTYLPRFLMLHTPLSWAGGCRFACRCAPCHLHAMAWVRTDGRHRAVCNAPTTLHTLPPWRWGNSCTRARAALLARGQILFVAYCQSHARMRRRVSCRSDSGERPKRATWAQRQSSVLVASQ